MTGNWAADRRMQMPITVNMNNATIIRNVARDYAGNLLKMDIIWFSGEAVTLPYSYDW